MIGCVRCEKFNIEFFGASVGKTALPREFFHTVPSEMKVSKTHQTRVMGQTGMIGCVRWEKLNSEFFGALVEKMATPCEFCRTVPSEMKVPKTHKQEFWVNRR